VGASEHPRLAGLALVITLALGVTNAHACLTTPAPSNMVTSLYGWRFHPVYKRWQLHAGTDFRAQLNSQGVGETLIAAQAGTIQLASSRSGGNELRIVGSDGTVVRYLHLTKAIVKPGAQVTVGQQVAISGGTGEASAAPHLHFEVYVSKHTVSAIPLLCNPPSEKSGANSVDGFPILQCDPSGGQQCAGSNLPSATAGNGGGATGSSGSTVASSSTSAGAPPPAGEMPTGTAGPVDSSPTPAPDTSAWDDMSTIELITSEVTKRFENPDWYKETSERTQGPLLQDFMQMMALDNYMDMRQTLSNERIDELWAVKAAYKSHQDIGVRLNRQRSVVNRSGQ
jgi:murein DD-endopeptidase MepM/ murein hydrolase activator NlpD